MVPSLIAVAPRKTVKTADIRGDTAETLNLIKTSAVPQWVGQTQWDRRGTAMTAVAPYKDRSSTSIAAVPPQYNLRAIAKTVDWRPYGDPVALLLRLLAMLPRCYHGVTTGTLRVCCRSANAVSPSALQCCLLYESILEVMISCTPPSGVIHIVKMK